MKKINTSELILLEGGLCINDVPGLGDCPGRCYASMLAYTLSGGAYPGPVCIA